MRTSTLVGTALATASTAVIGSIASKRGVQTWYPKLDKPGYVPPNVVFPVAWTTLYADIAVTSASTIDRMRDDGDDARRRNYVAALGVNLVLNAGWSWLFFRLNKLGPSVDRRCRAGRQQRRPGATDRAGQPGRGTGAQRVPGLVHLRGGDVHRHLAAQPLISRSPSHAPVRSHFSSRAAPPKPACRLPTGC